VSAEVYLIYRLIKVKLVAAVLLFLYLVKLELCDTGLVSVFKDAIEALSGSRDSLRYLLTDLDQIKPLNKSADSGAKYSIFEDSQREYS
jgi:hypothetical protein